MPRLVQAHKQFKDKGFTIIGISLDKEADRAKYKDYIKENEMNWVHVMDGKFWDAELAKKYSIRGIPALFLLDPNGKCVADSRDLHGSEDALEKQIEKVMKETPPTAKGGLTAGRAEKMKAEFEAIDGLVAKKKYAEAVKSLEKIAKKQKGTEYGEQAAARLKELKSDKKIAMALRDAEAKKHAPIMLKDAATLAEAGKTEQARKYYQKVIDKYPGTEYAKQAEDALRRLEG